MTQKTTSNTKYVNGINLAYEIHGSKSNPVICLIHGLGSPLTAWPENFVELLVEQNLCVLLVDNRDVGRSQKMDHLKLPNMGLQWIKKKFGFKVAAPYELMDMMHDIKALLRVLKFYQVHVVGASMGGMIAQLLAIHSPHTVKSLTSIMSTTSNPSLPAASKAVLSHFALRQKSSSPEETLSFTMNTWRLIGSPKYPTTDHDLKSFTQRLIERGIHAAGTARQALAIMAAPSRVSQLQELAVPCLVIHGEDDPLVPLQGGIDTAEAIPGADLHILNGMGHDLPKQLHKTIQQLITDHIHSVEITRSKPSA